MTVEAGVREAPFLTGSTMRHVITMTLTGALGLMAMFMVDLADLYFLSLLNQTEVTAAIGYAGTITFVNLSLAIGFGIASAALVARNIGAGGRERAKQFAGSTLMIALLGSFVLTLVIAAAAPWLLAFLGASGEALSLATKFIWTLTPGFVLLTGAISCSVLFARTGRCAPRHVHHAFDGHRHRRARSAVHLRLRHGHAGRRHRECLRLCHRLRHRIEWPRARAQLPSAAAVRGDEARSPRHRRNCGSGDPDTARDTFCECLCHPRNGALRRRGGGCIGDRRQIDPRGLRRHLRAVGFGRSDHWPEFRRAKFPARASGAFRRDALRRHLYAGGVAAHFPLPQSAVGGFQRRGPDP
ncbi:MAG: hypothetical protein HC869_04985 [Rhodospirillales bacterium]|nr:hypothetical protein [Rhodospirillales bacterium]